MSKPASLYATWYDRLFAFVIDVVILFIPTILVLAFTSSTDGAGKIVPAPESAVIVFLLQMAYFVYFLGGDWQATPGMRVMAVHLIRTNGKALGQREALERFLALMIPSLPFSLSFLPASVTSNIGVFLHILWFAPVVTTRVGIHDRLCGMRVINGRIA